jgi:putative addiction module component (TIGR02574 family)
MTRAEQLVEEALQLPEDDREWIVDRLSQSIEGDSAESVEAAWAVEIDRRIKEIDEGKVELRPWDETMAELKARFVR